MAGTQQIVFVVGEAEYGMDVSKVSAIETLEKVVPVPNTANHILGIINLRGEVLPVYSLRSKFGMQEIPVDAQTKIIIAKSRGTSVAFKVDMVKGIIECVGERLSEFPGVARVAETSYVDQVLMNDGSLILLVNQDELLKEEESKAIAEMIEKLKD